MLESEGLIVSVAHTGTTVAPVSRQLDRRGLRPARRAGDRLGPRGRARRKRRGGCHGSSRLRRSHGPRPLRQPSVAWAELNTEFHLAISRLSGMPMVDQMLRRALDHWDRVRRYFFTGVFTRRAAARTARAPAHARAASRRRRRRDRAHHAGAQSRRAAGLRRLPRRRAARRRRARDGTLFPASRRSRPPNCSAATSSRPVFASSSTRPCTSGAASPLAQPLAAARMRAGNRFCILPMEGWDGTTRRKTVGSHRSADGATSARAVRS